MSTKLELFTEDELKAMIPSHLSLSEEQKDKLVKATINVENISFTEDQTGYYYCRLKFTSDRAKDIVNRLHSIDFNRLAPIYMYAVGLHEDNDEAFDILILSKTYQDHLLCANFIAQIMTNLDIKVMMHKSNDYIVDDYRVPKEEDLIKLRRSTLTQVLSFFVQYVETGKMIYTHEKLEEFFNTISVTKIGWFNPFIPTLMSDKELLEEYSEKSVRNAFNFESNLYKASDTYMVMEYRIEFDKQDFDRIYKVEDSLAETPYVLMNSILQIGVRRSPHIHLIALRQIGEYEFDILFYTDQFTHLATNDVENIFGGGIGCKFTKAKKVIGVFKEQYDLRNTIITKLANFIETSGDDTTYYINRGMNNIDHDKLNIIELTFINDRANGLTEKEIEDINDQLYMEAYRESNKKNTVNNVITS